MAEEANGQALDKAGAAALDKIQAAIFGDADALPPAADPGAMSRAIAERILEAQTFEEAFKPQGLASWQDLMGIPVLVRDVHFNRSTIEGGEGSPVYAVVDLVDSNGQAHTVSCGGVNVLTQLVSMLKHGWQDKLVKLVEKTTAQGYNVLWLEAA